MVRFVYFTTFSENLASCCEFPVALVLFLHSYQQKNEIKFPPKMENYSFKIKFLIHNKSNNTESSKEHKV